MGPEVPNQSTFFVWRWDCCSFLHLNSSGDLQYHTRHLCETRIFSILLLSFLAMNRNRISAYIKRPVEFISSLVLQQLAFSNVWAQLWYFKSFSCCLESQTANWKKIFRKGSVSVEDLYTSKWYLKTRQLKCVHLILNMICKYSDRPGTFEWKY